MGFTKTQTGEIREDKYWLLQSLPRQSHHDKELDCIVEPVYDAEVSLDVFEKSYKYAQAFKEHHLLVHGRRINDEVELFQWNDGKETSGLRDMLERKGITVRTYVPQPETNAFKPKYPKPSFKIALGKPKTPLEKCEDMMKRTIDEMAVEYDTTIEYGLVAASERAKMKKALVVNMREKEFRQLGDEEKHTFSSNGETFPVIATIEDGEPRFKYDDERVTSLFTKDYTHVDAQLLDQAKRLEQEEWEAYMEKKRQEKEAYMKEKKQAKKHRRQMTESRATSLSETTHASPPVESEEAVKLRQRQKEKAKKKAQKERKKARAEESWSNIIIATIPSDDNEEETSGQQRTGDSQAPATVNGDSNDAGEESKKTNSGEAISSSEASDDDDNDYMYSVIQVETKDDLNRLIEEQTREGQAVLVGAGAEGLVLQRADGKKTGLKHVD